MARNSSNSNKTEKSKNGDSLDDSEDTVVGTPDTQDDDKASSVIEGEASDITDELKDAELADSDEVAELTDSEGDALSSVQDDESEEDGQQKVEEHQAESVPVVASAPEPTRGSVVPLVFGGLIAGAIGFGASHFGVLNSNQAADSDASSINTQVETLGTEMEALTSKVAGLASDMTNISPIDIAPVYERLDSLAADVEMLQSARATSVEASTNDMSGEMMERIEALDGDVTTGMSGLAERIAGLEDRLTDMQMAQEKAAEADPTGDMADNQLAAFQSELETLTADATAQVEEAKERASAFEKAAAEAAAKAERQGAIAALTSAVESGSSFTEELELFAEPPNALAAAAEAGVPTIGDLQRDFPGAARAALSTATVVPQDASAGERLTAFLKRQTNARSLAPKEGDSTDAVLSRAEARVAEGDLDGSLKELSSLSDDAKDVLGPWMVKAQTRLDALAALSELSAAKN